ncbi:CHAT domain-containing protein [Streptomyces sp. NPDC018338]|uniref:CHAT domain-containing protein n=1 Tax=Streptomyces sp. NPDC018338 TaxID=3157192 RepID=UPI0033E4C56D
MEFGERLTPNRPADESDDVASSRERLAELSESGQFLVAIGAAEDLVAALEVASVVVAEAIRIEVTATAVAVHMPEAAEERLPTVLWIRPNLHFDLAEIGRVQRAITRFEPKVVVVEGHDDSAPDDARWVGAVLDGWDTPEVLALATDDAEYGVSHDTSSTPVQPSRPPTARHVNTVVQRARDLEPVIPGGVLEVDTEYVLGIGIGPRRNDSLLGGDTSFPDEIFGGKARRVDVYLEDLDSAGAAGRRSHLYLPEVGTAFTCPAADALPEDTDWTSLDHRDCAGSHGDLARFDIGWHSEPCTLRLGVLVYVGVAVVHVQRIELSVGHGAGAIARVTYRLLHSFRELPDLTDRSVSVAEEDDHLTVNGVGHPSTGSKAGSGAFGFRVNDSQWNSAVVNARKKLNSRHFVKRDDSWHALYPNVDVPPHEYEESLKEVASYGRLLFNQLFNTSASRELAPMLQHEARARGAPAVIQIARTVQRPFVIPWQLVYELPLEHPEKGLVVCPSVAEYGPGGDGVWPPPAVCPHSEEHDRLLTERPQRALLCPYGFWGLAHVLEVPHPPPGRRDLDSLVTKSAAIPTIVTGVGSGLNRDLLKEHLARMPSRLTATEDSPLTEARRLGDALEPSTLDVVYLLSHCERTGAGGLAQALVFQDQTLTSDDVAVWARDRWPKDHWDGRRPLVFLNACYTAEIVASTMAGFVANFVAAGAAGVVGTETLTEQNAASFAAETFLTHFADGDTVGEAVRLMRWHLMGRGNLLGFSYTPYCAADLRLRAPT